MAKYVGKRIVPLPCGEWVQTKEYELLSVVLEPSSGDSYIARRQVSAGTAITDTAFWAKSSEWSQQVKNMSDQLAETLRQMKADNDATEAAIKADNDATENAIRQDNTNTRQHVDNITADALSRLADGSNELREAKNALTARMDSITGSATEETEVLDARVDLDDYTHDNLGDHIRGITRNLRNSLINLYGLTMGYYYPEFDWEPGSIASPANKDKTRIRTIGYRKATGNVRIEVDTGFRAAIKLFHLTESGYEEFYDSTWCRNTIILPESSGSYYRVALVYDGDEVEIPISESIHVRISEQMDSLNAVGDLQDRTAVLEESEEKFYEGLESLKDLSTEVLGHVIPRITWVQGSHTGFNNHVSTRIKNEGVLLSRGTITISMANGYFGSVMMYDREENGTYTRTYNSGWCKGKLTVPDSDGQYYTVCLCTSTAETTDIDPSEGVNMTVVEVTNEDSLYHRLIAADAALDGKMDTLKSSFGAISNKDLKTSITVRSIAHRGDDRIAPQCTAPAYILARKEGFTITENDLFHSKDGEFVMWHDPTLGRLGYLRDINGYLMYTNGTDFYWYDGESVYLYNDGYTKTGLDVNTLTAVHGSSYSVTELDFAVLRRIDFGYWFDPRFAGTQILTFEEWVLLCKQLGMEIYVDRKFVYTDEQAGRLVSIVRKYGMLDHTSWITGVGLARTIRNYDPNARCGVLSNPTQSIVDSWSDLAHTGRGVFFDGKATDLTAEAAQIAVDNGIDLGCYYVDFGSITAEQVYEEVRRLVSIGVQEITIDHYLADEAFQYLLDRYN